MVCGASGRTFPGFCGAGCLIPYDRAVTPVPDTLSEYAFAGLLRGTKTEVVKCISNDLEVPASAEIVLEGYIEQGETAPEGPYGDHTGYYNEVKVPRYLP